MHIFQYNHTGSGDSGVRMSNNNNNNNNNTNNVVLKYFNIDVF